VNFLNSLVLSTHMRDKQVSQALNNTLFREANPYLETHCSSWEGGAN